MITAFFFGTTLFSALIKLYICIRIEYVNKQARLWQKNIQSPQPYHTHTVHYI